MSSKRPFVHHYWRYIGEHDVQIHWMSRARPGEPGELQSSPVMNLSLYECRTCGMVHAALRIIVEEQTTYVHAYGLDRDSLANCAAPSCEVWVRPPTPEAPPVETWEAA